jgi:hypothetical protein
MLLDVVHISTPPSIKIFRRRVVTVALANHVGRLDFPAEAGVSTRAVRVVFKMMAKIANNSGEFRYGIRGSKLPSLTDYSLSVVRRGQHYLVAHGYIERAAAHGDPTSLPRLAVGLVEHDCLADSGNPGVQSRAPTGRRDFVDSDARARISVSVPASSGGVTH